MKNIANKITAIVIMIYLAAVCAVMAFGRRYTVKDDIKVLAKNRNAECANELAAKHFPKRDLIVSLESRLRAVLAERIVNGVYIDDTMLLDAEVDGSVDVEKTARSINAFARDYDGAIYLVTVPTSSGVYENLLPEYLKTGSEVHTISKLYDMLENEIREIDAYNILKMLNENYIYYRNDTKWTSYGAYCVYRTVIQKLGFSPIPYDKYTIDHVADDFKGDLYEKTLYSKAKPDIIDIYRYPSGAEIKSCVGYDNNGKVHKQSLYDKSNLDSGNMYDVYFGKKYPLMKISTSVSNERKLLVITDSYGYCFVPFLAQHYSEIAVISPKEAKRKLTDYVDPSSYEQTLFLFGVDSLEENYISDILQKKGS